VKQSERKETEEGRKRRKLEQCDFP